MDLIIKGRLFMKVSDKPNLLHTISLLTLVFIFAQTSLFFIHFKVTELMDALINSSIALDFLHFNILLPIFLFVTIQLIAYALVIAFVWLLAHTIGELFSLSQQFTYALGIVLWCLVVAEILLLNQYYFSGSFFTLLLDNVVSPRMNLVGLMVITTLLCLAIVASYVYIFINNRYQILGGIFIALVMITVSVAVHDRFFAMTSFPDNKNNSQPNIIFIGLDSLRPDFVGYFGRKDIKTPNIDQFLAQSTIFTNAYTPLARTFPSWISILTAKYPKNSGARNNLIDPTLIFSNDTIAKRFQRAGYETIYATDEKRFSNITASYGFDQIIGPEMGVNDFVLGGLSDLPLTNLLINLPISRFLFPYNYGNRAAAITYKPDVFLRLVKLGLGKRSDKPLFFAIHLCLSHWPYTWANKQQYVNALLPDMYHRGIEGVDEQLGKLMQILKQDGLLQNALVVLLSDHGTTLGLLGDRFISQEHYLGDPEELKVLNISRLSNTSEYSVDFAHDYSISTAYGYGSDILSLIQNHSVLAFRSFNLKREIPKQVVKYPVSLIDISPTVLDYLQLKPLEKVDGISLKAYFSGRIANRTSRRALFMETGDSLSEIETDHIYVEKVLKKEIGIYQIDPKNGLLSMSPKAEDSLIKNKQFSIMLGNWLFASYPGSLQLTLAPDPATKKMVFKANPIPPYFVLVNLKTGQWTLDLNSSFANTAPLRELIQQFKQFYQAELAISPRRIPRAI